MHLTPEIITALTQTERGNTLLVQPDNEGVVLIANLGEGQWFYAQFLPGNYPAFTTFVVLGDVAKIVHDIRVSFGGWIVRKNQLNVPTDDGAIVGIEEE